MNDVYLAAPFSWQQKIKGYANQLRLLGYNVTSQWLEQKATFTNDDNTTNQEAAIQEQLNQISVRDLRNILASDTLILFEPGIPLERNTRVSEFGAALVSRKQCVVIGPEAEKLKNVFSSVFIHLRNIPSDLETLGIRPVIKFQSWDLFLEDILHPKSVSFCSGCGQADCDSCPCGTFQGFVSLSGLRVKKSTIQSLEEQRVQIDQQLGDLRAAFNG